MRKSGGTDRKELLIQSTKHFWAWDDNQKHSKSPLLIKDIIRESTKESSGEISPITSQDGAPMKGWKGVIHKRNLEGFSSNLHFGVRPKDQSSPFCNVTLALILPVCIPIWLTHSSLDTFPIFYLNLSRFQMSTKPQSKLVCRFQTDLIWSVVHSSLIIWPQGHNSVSVYQKNRNNYTNFDRHEV